MKDVFANEGEFFKFEKAGDAIQGTFVAQQGPVKDSFDNDQILYILKDTGGKMWKVGLKWYPPAKKADGTLKYSIHNEVATKAKLGQIIGFRFDGKKPSAANPGRFFNAYSFKTEGEMDTQWLAENPQEGQDEADLPSASTPVATAAPQAEMPNDKGLTAVRNMARQRGLVKDVVSDEEVDAAIMLETGLEVVEQNFPQIITKLAAFKN